MKQDESIRAFKKELSNYDYYHDKLKRRKEKLQSLFECLPGSVHGVDPSKEPIHSAPNKDFEYKIRDEIDLEEKKINLLQMKIEEMDNVLDRMPSEAKEVIRSVCIKHNSYHQVARRMYISDNGLKKMVNRTIKKALDD